MNKIGNTTKLYLIASLNEEIQNNKDETIYNSLKKYKTLFEKKSVAEPGGFGVGSAEKSNRTKPTVSNILRGDTDDTGVGLAVGAYAAGGLGQWLGNLIGTKIGTKAMGLDGKGLANRLGKSLGVGGAQMIQKLGTQIGDITGFNFANAQADKIGRDQVRLGIQGAGSPPVEFELPGAVGTPKYKAEPKPGPNDDLKDLRDKIEREQVLRQARRYGIPIP